MQGAVVGTAVSVTLVDEPDVLAMPVPWEVASSALLRDAESWVRANVGRGARIDVDRLQKRRFCASAPSGSAIANNARSASAVFHNLYPSLTVSQNARLSLGLVPGTKVAA